MGIEALVEGYRVVLDAIYSPAGYYRRVTKFLKDFEPRQNRLQFNGHNILALLRSIVVLGVIGKERAYYWKLFFWSLFRKPQLFSLAIRFSIYGYHFRKVLLTVS